MTCFKPFHFLQAAKSQNVLTCKFTVNQLHVDFVTRSASVVMKCDSFKQGRYYKMGQVLQNGATFFTKWGYYYKSSAVQKATETNGGG